MARGGHAPREAHFPQVYPQGDPPAPPAFPSPPPRDHGFNTLPNKKHHYFSRAIPPHDI